MRFIVFRKAILLQKITTYRFLIGPDIHELIATFHKDERFKTKRDITRTHY
jgi:hypothetical protein